MTVDSFVAEPNNPKLAKTNAGEQFRYRADIDGLRAIAVLAVLLCHASLGMPGGYIGVDVFFVISGYLITSIIIRDIKQERFSFLGFWERRVRRIFPALAAVVISTTIAAWVILLPADLASFGSSLIWVTLMAANIFFWRTTDYFDVASEEKPLLHMWSLGVEEQFYIFIPLLIVLFFHWKQEKRIGASFALASLASFGLSLYGVMYRPAGTFYLLPTRAWELLAGCLIALGWFRGLQNRRLLSESLSLAGLVMIFVPCILYTEDTSFPGPAALPPVIGTVFIIAAGSRHPTWVSSILSNRVLVYIGLTSYSLYLWHWPIFSLCRYLAIDGLSTVTRWCLCFLSLGMASISLHCIETPFRKRTLFGSRWAIQSAAFLTACVVLATGAAVYNAGGFPSRLNDLQRAYQATGVGSSEWLRNLDDSDVPDNLLEFGAVGGEFEVLVWGDSHARAILPAVDKVCRELGLAGAGAIRSANPPVLGVSGRSHLGGNEITIPFNENVVKALEARPIRAVFMASYWDIYLDDPEFEARLSQTIERIVSRGIAVFVLRDVPRYDFDVPRFAVAYAGMGLSVTELNQPQGEYIAKDLRFSKLISAIEASGGQLVTLADWMPKSDSGTAYSPVDGRSCLYSDSHHLSVAGSMYLVQPITEALMGIPTALNAGELGH